MSSGTFSRAGLGSPERATATRPYTAVACPTTSGASRLITGAAIIATSRAMTKVQCSVRTGFIRMAPSAPSVNRPRPFPNGRGRTCRPHLDLCLSVDTHDAVRHRALACIGLCPTPMRDVRVSVLYSWARNERTFRIGGGRSMKSLTLCGVVWLVVALSAQAGAEDVYDLSIAGFGGFAIPQETRVTQSSPTRNENFTARNVQLDSGGSYGVKLTAWTTALREKNGFDLGIELDHTRFSADTRAQTVAASGVSNGVPVHSAFVNKNDVSARTIAVNALFRIPFGITDQLPHGRW